MIPSIANPEKYNSAVAMRMCQASIDAYRGPAFLGSVQFRWGADVCNLIEIEGNEVLCMAGRGQVVIAFRGTSSFSDALRDLTAKRADWNGLSVHQGFLEGWAGREQTADKPGLYGIRQAVQNWLAANSNPEDQVFVTGHSLGGALATLCAVSLSEAGPAPTLYTFGSPRVGGRAFAWHANRQLADRHFRVTHNHDIVPWVPVVFRTNWMLPDCFPLLPTLRPLVHCGQHTHLVREIERTRRWTSGPTDHLLERYRQAISDNY